MNVHGAVQLRQPKVARSELTEIMAALPPCAIGVEACTGARHWARQFDARADTVKLMAPKLVAPYRMTSKRGKDETGGSSALTCVADGLHWPYAR